MALNYDTLELLRRNHPAWRLLCAQHPPLVAGFLHRVFIALNVRNLSQIDLVEALEDELFVLREQLNRTYGTSVQNVYNASPNARISGAPHLTCGRAEIDVYAIRAPKKLATHSHNRGHGGR